MIGGSACSPTGAIPKCGARCCRCRAASAASSNISLNNTGCRVTKTQIFNSVYGLFSEDIDENVIESHISKLRKRLRHRLGHDPIQSQRYLGYR